ncbi:MAG: dihydropteroate synthase [Bacteroidetes bacterium]|nr:dihydropteroate synthase [Bacteroidota bacterium]
MTINCKGILMDLSTPRVMGILNVTPDSFHDGGRYTDIAAILQRAGQMIQEGADIIDVGGMSSKPGGIIISPEEELSRVVPAIEAIHEKYPDVILSIDTIHAAVAAEAVAHGASIINDISAGALDKDMIHTVAALKVPYIIMHMQGTPETMQQAPTYQNVVTEVMDYLIVRMQLCREAGIKDVIIDPGFGFGKTNEHNFALLKKLALFKILNVPILAGLSRKSMITKTLGIKNAEALNGTTALNMAALINGANILRVHDVKEAREAIALYLAMIRA